MNSLDIQSLFQHIPKPESLQMDKYIITYPSYVEYFADLKVVSKNDLVRGIGFVYSWMPKILSINYSQINELSNCINNLKTHCTEIAEINVFKLATHFTDGSIVAASKLLHFIFPKQYPIYDSHVYRYCWNDEKSHHYKIKREDNYCVYKRAILNTLNTTEAKELTQVVIKAIGYNVSEVRAIEFAIFMPVKPNSLFYLVSPPYKENKTVGLLY